MGARLCVTACRKSSRGLEGLEKSYGQKHSGESLPTRLRTALVFIPSTSRHSLPVCTRHGSRLHTDVLNPLNPTIPMVLCLRPECRKLVHKLQWFALRVRPKVLANNPSPVVPPVPRSIRRIGPPKTLSCGLLLRIMGLLPGLLGEGLVILGLPPRCPLVVLLVVRCLVLRWVPLLVLLCVCLLVPSCVVLSLVVPCVCVVPVLVLPSVVSLVVVVPCRMEIWRQVIFLVVRVSIRITATTTLLEEDPPRPGKLGCRGPIGPTGT